MTTKRALITIEVSYNTDEISTSVVRSSVINVISPLPDFVTVENVSFRVSCKKCGHADHSISRCQINIGDEACGC
jgi:hypothetical protein